MPPRHRTTARGILFLIIIAGVIAGGGATPSAATPAKRKVPPLIFPVVGPATYIDDFGDARGSGSHQGNDIMAPKRALAVAAEAGTVKYHTTSWRAGCMLYLYGASGTTYIYIHLNNDLTTGNDNTGRCIAGVAYATHLRSGARVAAGEPIAYVGDSGDADGGSPHLHFEVHPGGGGAVSPYTYLRKARKLLFAARPGTEVSLTLNGSIVEAARTALSVKVDRLRASTGLSVAKVARTVELFVPPETAVFNPLGALIASAKLVSVKPGQKTTVLTEPAIASLETQLAQPLMLATRRVTLATVDVSQPIGR